MKKYLSFSLLMCIQLVYLSHVHAQWNSPNRYRANVFTFDQIIPLADVAYTTNVYDAYYNSFVTLYLNIAGPDRSIDGVKKRPLIVMVHGGAFNNDIGRGKEKYNTQVMELAKMGYVVATIDYRCYGSYAGASTDFRQGWEYYRTDLQGGTSGHSNIEWYTAAQDLNAAIKFLCFNSHSYGIDTNNVFLFGESAGAITALTLATAKQAEIDEYFNFRQYVGNLSASTLPVCRSQTYTIRGLAPVAGGLPYASFLDLEDQIPMIMESNVQDPLALAFNAASSPMYYDGISSTGMMNKIKGWSSSYPCSYFYFTQGGAYDAPVSGEPNHYHTLNKDGWAFFKFKMTPFFADILQQTTVCQPQDFSAPNYHIYSSINPSPVVQFRAGLTDTGAPALSVYPNPATDNITIRGLAETSEVEITLYDGLGARIKTYTFQTAPEEHSISLPLEGLADGMYYIRIKDALNDKQIKLLKQ